MTDTTAKVERLRTVDHELAMDGLTAARRKQLAMEKASLLADPEVHMAYRAADAGRKPNGPRRCRC
jgi:hypothetical protein